MSTLDRYVPGNPDQEPTRPLSRLVDHLRRKVKSMVAALALTTCPIAKVEGDLYPETVKFPPKPGEDDGIYSERIARAQRSDF